jgi:hypothetical protein
MAEGDMQLSDGPRQRHSESTRTGLSVGVFWTVSFLPSFLSFIVLLIRRQMRVKDRSRVWTAVREAADIVAPLVRAIN